MIARSQDARGQEAFARSLLAAATEIEAAEARIKQAVLDAAQAGNTARVIDIVTRWQTLPSIEVLAGIPLIDAENPR